MRRRFAPMTGPDLFTTLEASPAAMPIGAIAEAAGPLATATLVDTAPQPTPYELALAAVKPLEVTPSAYAGHLIDALKEFSGANSNRAFIGGVERGVIGTRTYRSRTATEHVAFETLGKPEARIESARREFYRAHGVGFLATIPKAQKGQPVDPNADLVRREIERRWGDFVSEYSGTGPVAAKRRRYIRELEKQRQPIHD